MISYVSNDIATRMPLTIDGDRLSSIEVASSTPIVIANDNVSVLVVDANLYRLDFSKLTETTEISISNADSEVSVTVYKSYVRVDHLKQWLTMQQLSFLIPILEKVGWDKLKEAALKAKQIMGMQGAEQALSMMLNLLDADNNVELYRYWEHDGQIVYDDMRAMDLAFLGYALTNKLKLAYKQDKLNPWSDKVETTIQTMMLTLQEVVECIKAVLPATLEISDYQLLRLGIGFINMAIMTSQSYLQKSDVEIVASIDVPSVIQYSYENYVYDLVTGELIRIAKYYEPNSQGAYMAIMQMHSEHTVYNVTIDIDGVRYITCDKLSGSKAYVITPPDGIHDMTYAYSSASGNRFSKTVKLTVLKASNRQDIYALCEPNDNSQLLEPANLSAVFVKWRDISYACNGRPINLDYFKPYQQFFVPFGDKLKVRANDGIAMQIIYNIGTGDYSAAFSNSADTGIMSTVDNSLFTMSIVKLRPDGAEDSSAFFCLTSKQYMSMYEFTVEYFDWQTETWQKAKQLGKIMSETVQPHWDVNTLQWTKAHLGNPATAKISIGGHDCFNGGYMPLQAFDNDFCRRLSMSERIRCNQDIDTGDMLSVSIVADNADFKIDTGTRTFTIADVRRPASYGIESVGECHDSIPYIVFRPNTYIEVLSNDNVAFSGYGLVVFAKTTGNKYKVHLYNDWYDKLIEI